MLSGDHIQLRAITEADLPQLLEWRNRPELRVYFREYRELSAEHQRAWFEQKVVKDDATRMFAIVDSAGGDLIGACGLCYIDFVDRNADLSIYIGADGAYIDDRLAPDAAKVLLSYGFSELGLHRVHCEVYSIDTAKMALLESLGFTREGTHRQTHWTQGQWVDSHYFGLLADEFAHG